MKTRRILILALFVAVLTAAVWSTVFEPDLLFVRRVTVETEKWPPWRASLRIAVVSDLHVGAPHVDLAKLDRIVSEINGMQPDIVVILGDFVTGGVLFGEFVEPEPIANRLKNLSARYGVFAVLGNHDWWYDGQRVWRALTDAGIEVLENRGVRLDPPGGAMWLVGISDDMIGRADPQATIGPLPDGEPIIALTHSPAIFPDIAPRTLLTLAGHSHGGQVSFPVIGPLFIPGRSPLRYAYGHIRENGKDMYVTAGIGTSILPIRLNMPPEIALVTVESPSTALVQPPQ